MAGETIDSVFRDFNTPGNPASGDYEPEKPRIRAYLRGLESRSGQAITKNTLAALEAVTPPTENYMGIVLDDPDPANNGYYSRIASAWVWERGFPDTLASVTLSGTGTAQTGVVESGVNPAGIVEFRAEVATENTGPMTLSIGGEEPRPVVNLAGNALSAGEWTGVVKFFIDPLGNYKLANNPGSEAAAAQSATDAAASKAAAEDWAIEPEDTPVPVGSGGDGATTYSALHWAKKAEGFAGTVTGATPVADRTALKALNTASVTTAILKELGREGIFIFRSGDYSTEITADTQEGIYIKADAVLATGGAWVRQGEWFTNGVSVRWFGAVNDSVTDNTAAFQCAHDVLPSNGGSVYFPSSGDGDYLIASSINVTKNNVRYFSDNIGVGVIRITNHDFDVFNVTSGASFQLSTCHFVGSGTAGATPAFLVNATATSSVSLENVYGSGVLHSGFKLNFAETFVCGGELKGLKPLSGIAFHLAAATSEICQIFNYKVINATGADCFAGIYAEMGSALELSNVELVKCGTPLYVNVADGVNAASIVANNLWCDTSTGSGAHLKTAGTGSIKRVRLENSWFSSCERGIRISGNVESLIVNGSEIYDNTIDGIILETGTTLGRAVINSNLIAGNGGAGIIVGDNIDGFIITSNAIGPTDSAFGGNAGYAIALGAGVDDYTIADNDLTGNTSGSILGHSAHSATKLVHNNRGFVSRASGTLAGTPDGAGNLSITHGMSFTPAVVQLTVFGSSFVVAQPTAVSSTTWTINLKDAAGAAVTTSKSVYWETW